MTIAECAAENRRRRKTSFGAARNGGPEVATAGRRSQRRAGGPLATRWGSTRSVRALVEDRRYDRGVRWSWLAPMAVVACGVQAAPTRVQPVSGPPALAEIAPAVPPVPSPPPRSKQSERIDLVEPRGIRLVDPAERGLAGEGRKGNPGLGMVDVAESDFLSSCVRELVRLQPGAAQRALIAALAQYATACDGEGRVVLERPLGVDSRERRSRSDVAFTGTLSAQRFELVLRVAYCGGESAAPDHIAIVAPDATWTSSRLEFERDAAGCDVAELPYTRALGRALLRATTAESALIRFEGAGVRGELPLPDPVQHELRTVLDAVAALAAD
jgi:hypothetical protein